MTTHNGIQIPCFGTLQEIHAALIKDLDWLNNQVSINGWGYTVKEAGFQSNESGKCHDCLTLASLHKGTAVLYNLEETGFSGNYLGDLPDYYEIVTSGKVPHVSKRCAECGCQLNQDEIKRGACDGCYAAAVNL